MKNHKLRCIVENCYESGYQDSRSMFKFPANPAIRLKWIENVGISKNTNLYNRRLCRRHFEPNSFGEKEGLHYGVPKKKPFIRKCSIVNCPTRSPPDRLHLFPSEPQMHKKWLGLCNLKADSKWLFICGRHFRRSVLPRVNSKVPKDAIPELYLGWEVQDPLESSLITPKSEKLRRKKYSRSEAEDEGIDEENSKEACDNTTHKSCSNCVTLKDQLAAALSKIQKLEQMQEVSDTDEEEYIFMLMK
ncbi:uncharacterized protein LOC6502720 isoform X2 [Drosophila ananassae]|uniref:uncharacterized protein LOC6502720 isoform X2 n=1 Tax=Drosophila ananassae TaxID=7217 RepID=UPI001CFF8A9C|nr:uncharacterized protein LOC6502720 isoform X2 [Drosophila ananassae]